VPPGVFNTGGKEQGIYTSAEESKTLYVALLSIKYFFNFKMLDLVHGFLFQERKICKQVSKVDGDGVWTFIKFIIHPIIHLI